MKKIIAVIGAADAAPELLTLAREIGAGIAQNGWTLVTGGLSGVMEAASIGAHAQGGTVVGILPTATTEAANPYVTIPIATNMGHARNAIIAHTADALVAVGGGYGTLSEIAIAKKLGKRVFGLSTWNIEGVEQKESVEEVIGALKEMLGSQIT